jgi:hypothetical protein
MSRAKLVLAVTALVAFVLSAGAGAAIAYFVSTGKGTGSANVGTMKTVTISASAGTPTSPLIPGGSGDVVFKVTNPNNYPVSLFSVTLKSGGAITPDSGHASCSTTDSNPVVTVNVPSQDLPTTIATNTTTQVDLAGAASMDVAATTTCQGASFSVPIVISVQS